MIRLVGMVIGSFCAVEAFIVMVNMAAEGEARPAMVIKTVAFAVAGAVLIALSAT